MVWRNTLRKTGRKKVDGTRGGNWAGPAVEIIKEKDTLIATGVQVKKKARKQALQTSPGGGAGEIERP